MGALSSVKRPAYSRAEYISDAVVHVMGLSLAVVAVPALVVAAVVLRDENSALIGVSIYGACLIAMLLCSALYNMVLRPDWAWLLKRLDHSAIYLKIAGTYTPFAVLTGQGVALVAGLWGAALAGITLKVAAPHRFRALSILLYLGMGWAGVAAGGFFGALPAAALVLIATGGVLYTLGVIFHLWSGLPFHNTIWHVFVLVASFTFYAAVMVALVQG